MIKKTLTFVNGLNKIKKKENLFYGLFANSAQGCLVIPQKKAIRCSENLWTNWE
ncbi:MAG: hypothetical protein QG594_2480 [Bacteroidota bacterium]|nr:hypothetical protein [Bacteroidota bacterium]